VAAGDNGKWVVLIDTENRTAKFGEQVMYKRTGVSRVKKS
jgi:hypothetical protein